MGIKATWLLAADKLLVFSNNLLYWWVGAVAAVGIIHGRYYSVAVVNRFHPLASFFIFINIYQCKGDRLGAETCQQLLAERAPCGGVDGNRIFSHILLTENESKTFHYYPRCQVSKRNLSPERDSCQSPMKVALKESGISGAKTAVSPKAERSR